MKEDNLHDSKINFNSSIIKKTTLENDNSKLYLKGIKYFYGIDCSINYKDAYEIFSKIDRESNHKNNDILILLGIMHEKGLHVQKFYKKAIEYYKKAAKNGSAKGFYHLAQLAEKKILAEEDNNDTYDNIAFNYYTESANLGLSDAYARIGVIFEQGLINTKINDESAFENFEKSVKIDNNPVGLNGMGNAYYKGVIKAKNYEKAVEYYKNAIRGGNIDALYNLGICYEYGNGVERNYDKALDLYNKARERGHGEGTVNYAVLKIKIGIKNNNFSCFSECLHILQSAFIINKNIPEIYYFIGLMYEIGIDLFDDGNIIKNPYLAFINYQKAADLNYCKAFTKIGISLFNGIEGVFAHNTKASISMLKKAIENGDEEAKKFLDYIKNNIKE